MGCDGTQMWDQLVYCCVYYISTPRKRFVPAITTWWDRLMNIDPLFLLMLVTRKFLKSWYLAGFRIGINGKRLQLYQCLLKSH